MKIRVSVVIKSNNARKSIVCLDDRFVVVVVSCLVIVKSKVGSNKRKKIGKIVVLA